MKNTTFECNNCGAQFTKWTGRCLECGKWGTIVESQKSVKSIKSDDANSYSPVKTVSLNEIQRKNTERIKTNISELDRVLGGGLVPGSLILLGGEPGIGKSTLATQLSALIPNTLYISGEESAEQIKLRVERLKIKAETLRLGSGTNVESIIATIKAGTNQTSPQSSPLRRGGRANPLASAEERVGGEVSRDVNLAIIDSIQTLSSAEVEGEAGSLNQVRVCAVKLMEAAKSTGVTIVLIGQVTKEGTVAGPKTLEHLVDTVLYLEGERFHEFRILRAVKNRFGSTDEVGLFSMEETGLVEVKNPSAALLSGRPENVPGSAITCLIEGTRAFLVEIQALVTKTAFGYPQRRASGFDLNRLQMLIGVLSKRTGLPLESYDVFLNVVGGLRAEEPAADLAVILAIASALKNKQLPKNMAAFGEVGLGGEVRNVNQAKKRLEEIKKMGFEIAVVPCPPVPKGSLGTRGGLSGGGSYTITGLKIAPLKNVQEVVEKIIQ